MLERAEKNMGSELSDILQRAYRPGFSEGSFSSRLWRIQELRKESFPPLLAWRELTLSIGCNATQTDSLLAAGYETLKDIANANFKRIKELPAFGPTTAERVINGARQKLGLPPLNR